MIFETAQKVVADSGATVINPLYNGKKRTIMLVGASVVWGDGLDQTETYASRMQTQIDTHVSTQLGNWVGRCVHTDDWQASNNNGAYRYPSSTNTPTNVPFNANNFVPGFGTGDGSQVSGFNTSAVPPLGHWLNPTLPSAYTVQGSSKFNYESVSGSPPSSIPCGIFGYYSGPVGGATPGYNASYTVNGVATYHNDSSMAFFVGGQNIRGAAYWAASNNYIFCNIIGTGTLQVFVVDAGGNTVTLPSLGYGAGVIGGGNTTGITNFFLGPFSTITPGLGKFAIYFNSGGPVQLTSLQPVSGVQNSSHLLMQVCARNSYCLQDYINSDGTPIYDCNYMMGGVSSTYSPVAGDLYFDSVTAYQFKVTRDFVSGQLLYTTSASPSSMQQPSTSGTWSKVGGGPNLTYTNWVGGTSQTLTTLIKQSVFNQSSYSGTGQPVFIIFDSYNSMVTPGRTLNATTYANALASFASSLASSGARIIITMPFVPANVGFPFGTGAGYRAIDYRQALASMASSNSYSFIDQSALPSTTNTNFLFQDGLHPSSPQYDPGGTSTVGGGARQIAEFYIDALGL